MPEVQEKPAESTRAAAGRETSAADEPADALASLKKMSTTAGVGSQEYVAVNPMAVAAFLLGVATLLVFLHDVLLLIPLAGVVCAVIAWRQIANSNGTQTGKLMALAGLVLCLGVGGFRLGSKVIGGWSSRGDKAEIQRLIGQLGEHLNHEEYQAAYSLFTPRFQQRVSLQRFTTIYRDLAAHPQLGGVREMKWNGLVYFEEDAETNTRLAYAMAFATFKKAPEPGRQSVNLLKEGGKWLIDDLPAFFPREKKPGGAGGSPPGGADAGPGPR